MGFYSTFLRFHIDIYANHVISNNMVFELTHLAQTWTNTNGLDRNQHIGD